MSFYITGGERFLIVGENGVGKSTLLKLILGQLTPERGEIKINPKTDIAYYAQELELLDETNDGDLRQKIIDNYIVDFYSPKKQIVIELDGGQHYEDTAKQKDQERDSYLKSLGLTVLRYTNIDINKNFEGVCADIERYL